MTFGLDFEATSFVAPDVVVAGAVDFRGRAWREPGDVPVGRLGTRAKP
jgi:hypothetical protein